MRSDQELKLFIDGAQGNQRLALCLVSRGIREGDLNGVSPLSAILRDQRENDDLYYLKGRLVEEKVRQIVEFIKTKPSEICQIVDPGVFSDFWNQDEIYNRLKSSAAAPAAAAAAPPRRRAAAAAAPLRPAAAPAAAGGRARFAVPPPPAAAAGTGDGGEAIDWFDQGVYALRGVVAVGGGSVAGVVAATSAAPVALLSVKPQKMTRAFKVAYSSAMDAIKKGDLGAAVAAPVDAINEAYGLKKDPATAAAGGGGPGRGYEKLPYPVAKLPSPADAAAADAAAAAAAAAAGPAILADDEEKNKFKFLQTANPGTRLEVFDKDENKKRQYNKRLATILKNEPNYEKNKDSMFICFVSCSEETSANNAFLPYVTKTDFHKILNQDSFAITASQYAVACKVELGKDEEIEMGASKLSDQCFIDVNDSLNHTRIFLSKDNFTKLEEYKKDLVKEFKELLENDNASFQVETKGEIEDKIFEFGSIKDVKNAKGGPPAASPNNSIASIVGLTSTDDIDKYAQKLADQFWQRKLMKGDLSVEAKNASAADGYNEAQRLGHIKIVRPKTDKDRIKVYKVGSDEEIGLDNVNLGMGDQSMGDQIMQIGVKNITEDGVKGVQYFKENPQEKNNFNLNVDKKDLNDKVKKAKVDVFFEDLDNKKMSRFKIRGGKNESEPIGRNANKIVTPLSAQAPKIFTIEANTGVSNKIGTANGFTLGYVGRKGKNVDIKIRKDKKDNYKIQYGDKSSSNWFSFLSTHERANFINPVINKIYEENVKLKKKGAFLRKSWISSHFKTGDTESIKILVEDKNVGKIVELEITQEGSKLGNILGKRNSYGVRVVEERFEVPKTIFDPQSATSVAPTHGPGPATVRR